MLIYTIIAALVACIVIFVLARDVEDYLDSVMVLILAVGVGAFWIISLPLLVASSVMLMFVKSKG